MAEKAETCNLNKTFKKISDLIYLLHAFQELNTQAAVPNTDKENTEGNLTSKLMYGYTSTYIFMFYFRQA